jgi:predicted transcriptional regulator
MAAIKSPRNRQSLRVIANKLSSSVAELFQHTENRKHQIHPKIKNQIQTTAIIHSSSASPSNPPNSNEKKN